MNKLVEKQHDWLVFKWWERPVVGPPQPIKSQGETANSTVPRHDKLSQRQLSVFQLHLPWTRLIRQQLSYAAENIKVLEISGVQNPRWAFNCCLGEHCAGRLQTQLLPTSLLSVLGGVLRWGEELRLVSKSKRLLGSDVMFIESGHSFVAAMLFSCIL